MSFNMRDYVSNDHIESIGEIAKNQSAIIQALSLENSKLQNQLQQKENTIKEVREYIKQLLEYKKEDYYKGVSLDYVERILDIMEGNLKYK